MLVSPMSVSTIGLTDLIVSLASLVPRRLVALLEPNASAADGAAFSMSYVSGEDRGQETNPGTALSHCLLEYVTRRVYGGDGSDTGFGGPNSCRRQVDVRCKLAEEAKPNSPELKSDLLSIWCRRCRRSTGWRSSPPVMAALPGDCPVHCHVGSFPSEEAVMPAPRRWEPQIPPVLRTECGIGPDTAIAAVKSHDSEIGAGRASRAEAEHQKANRESQSRHYQLPALTTPFAILCSKILIAA